MQLKKLGKGLLRLFLLLLLFLGVGVASFFGYELYQNIKFQHDRPALVQAKDGTSTSPAWHNFAAYQEGLRRRYSFINKISNYVPPRTWDGKDAVIPGLVTTKAYDFKAKKWDTATAMTPQGITMARQYLLITAYDGDHRHSSVIYVLNKKTGKYLKTIQVPGRPHLGGIAYDRTGKNIWVTGSLGKSSALMSFSFKALENYQEAARLPIKYNHQIPIPTMERASTVTYYDNQLFVGFFNMYGRGKVASYPISRSGKNRNSITNNEIESISGSVSWSDPSGQTTMDKQIQGIAIYQGKIFLSQSYSNKDAKLYIFPTTALNSLDEKNAERVINMPPYLEQIYAYDGQLLCLFESGAKEYANPRITVMDRVLSININSLFGV